MRTVWALLAVFTLTASLAANRGAADAVPRLRVTPPEIDLGSRVAGPEVWFGYTLRNEGSAPLEIQDVKPSCGCMAAQWERTIPPGKETSLRVKMATEDKDGPVLKYVQL